MLILLLLLEISFGVALTLGLCLYWTLSVLKEMAGPMVEGNDPLTGHIISTTIGGKNGEPKRVGPFFEISFTASLQRQML